MAFHRLWDDGGLDRWDASWQGPRGVVPADLLAGDRSTIELARATGFSERACRYGLRHLIDEGYVWSPERGRYRLTARGRAIAADIPPTGAPSPEAPPVISAGSEPDPPRRRLLGRRT
jgi:hypothetical protein